MDRVLHSLTSSAIRRPWGVVAAWVLATVLAFGLAGTAGGALTDTYDMPGTDSQAATDLLRDRFPAFAGADARVVVHSPDGRLEPEVLARVAERMADVEHAEAVEPPRTSADGRTGLIALRYDVPVTSVDEVAAVAELRRAAQPAKDAGWQVEVGGEVPDQVYEQGLAEVVGFAAAALVLLVAFGSVVAAGLPLAMAALGLGIGMSLVTLVAQLTTVSTIAPTIASMVGIGVGIDYSLLIVSRHRAELLSGVDVPTALARAGATAGRSVVFAGVTVLVAICGLALSGVPNFVMIGVATAVVVLVAMVAAVSLLPALLALVGLRVLGRRTRRGLASGTWRPPSGVPLTARWAARTARHPWRYATGGLLALLLLCAPVLDMRLGQSDAGSEPTSSSTRRAYDLVETGFGRGANGPLLVVADLSVTRTDPSLLREELAATPGVAAVEAPVLDPAGSVALLTVVPTTGPQDRETDRLVSTLRADVLPDGVSVTGSTAAFMDFNQRLQDRLPLVVGAVVLTSLLLLVLVFRSVVVPLKAALLNLLSVGAAFGAVVALFQWGWGAPLLGLDGPVPVNAFVPMFLFAILFGLSMDYEVFLLSRVREEWQRTGDPVGSVVAGLGATGRVITSAALIMVTVFAGFALDHVVAVKMMGVGMAVAIAVDATLVRLVVAPATMVLLGGRNWWLPAWADRLLPDARVHGTELPPLDAPLEPELAEPALV
jgi:RND superfamily putative drug exporter